MKKLFRFNNKNKKLKTSYFSLLIMLLMVLSIFFLTVQIKERTAVKSMASFFVLPTMAPININIPTMAPLNINIPTMAPINIPTMAPINIPTMAPIATMKPVNINIPPPTQEQKQTAFGILTTIVNTAINLFTSNPNTGSNAQPPAGYIVPNSPNNGEPTPEQTGNPNPGIGITFPVANPTVGTTAPIIPGVPNQPVQPVQPIIPPALPVTSGGNVSCQISSWGKAYGYIGISLFGQSRAFSEVGTVCLNRSDCNNTGCRNYAVATANKVAAENGARIDWSRTSLSCSARIIKDSCN